MVTLCEVDQGAGEYPEKEGEYLVDWQHRGDTSN
jgi:hypothetical protein